MYRTPTSPSCVFVLWMWKHSANQLCCLLRDHSTHPKSKWYVLTPGWVGQTMKIWDGKIFCTTILGMQATNHFCAENIKTWNRITTSNSWISKYFCLFVLLVNFAFFTQRIWGSFFFFNRKPDSLWKLLMIISIISKLLPCRLLF